MLESETEEQTDSEDECVISKHRLKSLVECKCQENSTSVEFHREGFETIVIQYCAQCEHTETSMPLECHRHVPVPHSRVKGFYKTNVALVYLSILDYGFAGLRRLLGVLGIPPIGNSAYYRHVNFIYSETKKYYLTKHKETYQYIVKYYEEHMNVLPDENGHLDIDISYDGSWMKRGHTSHLGIGIIIEVCTGFVIDFEILNKFCSVCASKENLRKENKISEDYFVVWRIMHDDKCSKNFEGTSAAMEQEAASRSFGRSEAIGFRYANFLGDGDSSAYKSVCGMNNGQGPYTN